MKTVLVHDWLITRGGSEKVLEVLSEMFLAPPIYTLFYDAQKMESSFSKNKVVSSFLQNVPFSLDLYRYLLPFFPMAVEKLKVKEFDLVLSSSHAVAKGIPVREDQLHICYCHTPMRYIWDQQEEYLSSFPMPLKKMIRPFFAKMRRWDVMSSQGVDVFVANSHYVAGRIERAYQRKAHVIYPPVAVESFFTSNQKEDYYITHARLVPYKRIDLLVEAFNQMPKKRLLVVGTGPEEKKLKSKAASNVEFLGFVEEDSLKKLLSRAQAYLFAAEEDFGIGVVEAQSAGLPVIALGRGGVLETVVEGKTGIFFQEPKVSMIQKAVEEFEQKSFDPVLIKAHAQQFSVERFKQQFYLFLEEEKRKFYENRHLCRRERNAALAPFSK